MATRGKSGDPTKALQESVDKLADAFDKLATRLDAVEPNGSANGNGYHAGGSDADKFTRHIRRYVPFYALALVFAIFIFSLPSRPGGDNADTANSLTPGSEGFDSEGNPIGGDDGTSVAGAGTSRSGGGSGNAVATGTGTGGTTTAPGVEVFDPLAWKATGKTIGGFDCKPGVRQIPWSQYAVPCHPKWPGGNNGGATTRGVTDKEIVIVNREFPDSASSAAVDQVVQQAGFASADEFDDTRIKFVGYFNKVFELWGRKVKYIRYESEHGNSTDEALSKGKDGACLDADAIISKFKPFAVIGTGSTGVFGECAAARKLIAFDAGAYYPETWYRKHHPWIWAGVMECERIAYANAEYIGKRLANRPAKWSKDVLSGLDKSKRKIALIVPENDQYAHCVNIAQSVGEKRYGAKIASRYNYQLDIQRMPQEAVQAIAQFKAARATTIFLATDPILPIFLTQNARSQEYFPEWIINSAGLTDVEQFARLWDQQSIQWSLFGQSQLGPPERILGPKGEGTITYQKAFGSAIPKGTQTEYYSTMRMFSVLQGTGPVLTPDNMAAAIVRSPEGGAPDYEVGRTSYAKSPTGGKGYDHTAVEDIREVYWLCSSISGDAGGTSRCGAPKAYDGAGGTYVATFGGKRFLPGQWPKGDPPVFPEKP